MPPRQHVTHASTPLTPSTLAHQPRKHASTSPTQARHPRHTREHITNASTSTTPHTLARHPRKNATHATHASTNNLPFLKLTDVVLVQSLSIHLLIIQSFLMTKLILPLSTDLHLFRESLQTNSFCIFQLLCREWVIYLRHGQLVGFRYEILTSLVAVLLKITLYLCIYFVFTIKPLF